MIQRDNMDRHSSAIPRRYGQPSGWHQSLQGDEITALKANACVARTLWARTILFLAAFALAIGPTATSSEMPGGTRFPIDRRPACCFTEQGCGVRADCTQLLKEEG